jgi:DNA-binding winged helix-turn-helix (wHTH) protein
VLEREDIYQRVWGYTMARGDRSVDVFVRKLRQKLERISPGWHYVHTHFGVGYRFAAEGPGGSEPEAAGQVPRRQTSADPVARDPATAADKPAGEPLTAAETAAGEPATSPRAPGAVRLL